MYTIEFLKKKLQDLGFGEVEIQKVIPDVTQIIIGKSLVIYFSQLPETEQAKIKTLTAEELIHYIEENKTRLPQFSMQSFEEDYDETWDDYFKNISS